MTNLNQSFDQELYSYAMAEHSNDIDTSSDEQLIASVMDQLELTDSEALDAAIEAMEASYQARAAREMNQARYLSKTLEEM